ERGRRHRRVGGVSGQQSPKAVFGSRGLTNGVQIVVVEHQRWSDWRLVGRGFKHAGHPSTLRGTDCLPEGGDECAFLVAEGWPVVAPQVNKSPTPVAVP